MAPNRAAPAIGRRGKTAVLIAVLFFASVLLGPRARIDPAVPIPRAAEGLEQLDSYVRAAESAVPDLVPGTEAKILWADPLSPARTPISVVYLHGFSASHRETAPLTEELAAALDANAYLTRMTGHGRSGEALGDATGEDWLRDAAEAIEIGGELGESVVLLGVSTGGTLATWLAAQPEWRDDVEAMILISPNFGIADPRAWILTAPWGRQIARIVQGPERSFEPVNEAQATYWTERYPTRVLPELGALVRFVDEDVAGRVRAPTLVFASHDDRIIDPSAVSNTYDALGADRKDLVWMDWVGDPSSHVLAGDILSPESTTEVLERILEFLNRSS